MNRKEHLLVCLSEECDEVGQRISKALRFGLDEVQDGQHNSNRQRIADELCDLLSVAYILHSEGLLPNFAPPDTEIDAKLAKIERFMEISREQGVLEIKH